MKCAQFFNYCDAQEILFYYFCDITLALQVFFMIQIISVNSNPVLSTGSSLPGCRGWVSNKVISITQSIIYLFSKKTLIKKDNAIWQTNKKW